ncbi:hypothetical protein [Streptomyces cadmiisoli]|uniref:hypothetical protein n=1 Tax=Streptomyces cadmiisoli TaxID=2184053 RepID=UPI003D74183C
MGLGAGAGGRGCDLLDDSGQSGQRDTGDHEHGHEDEGALGAVEFARGGGTEPVEPWAGGGAGLRQPTAHVLAAPVSQVQPIEYMGDFGAAALGWYVGSVRLGSLAAAPGEAVLQAVQAGEDEQGGEEDLGDQEQEAGGQGSLPFPPGEVDDGAVAGVGGGQSGGGSGDAFDALHAAASIRVVLMGWG